MSIEVVSAALNLASALGISDVRLTGGEPTVHPKFKHIVDLAEQRSLRIGLVSNGVRFSNKSLSHTMLQRLSRCWISLYGPTPQDHGRLGGKGARPFLAVVEQVGSYTNAGYPVGLSVLVEPGAEQHVDALLQTAADCGVSRLRLLPLQPDGRANDTKISWQGWPEEVLRIARVLREHPVATRFSQLTINDPFDLGKQHASAAASCLLHSRKMWSIVPNGDIYGCCFGVYSDAFRVGNVMDADVCERLADPRRTRDVSRGCHGLVQGFWKDAAAVSISCPISCIDPRAVSLRENADH